MGFFLLVQYQNRPVQASVVKNSNHLLSIHCYNSLRKMGFGMFTGATRTGTSDKQVGIEFY
jgi:hypothetical protein